jgi:transcriptional regulator with XRE-family HTH domain
MERARWLARRIGLEIATARKARGWTQEQLAERTRTSQSAVSRLERGWPEASIELLTGVCRGVGLDFTLKAFPADGVVIRDERHAALVGLVVARAHPSFHRSLEVRVGAGPADRRAVDIVLASSVEVWAMEVERDVADLQLELRTDQLKVEALAEREARPVRLILALPDTRRLRDMVRRHEAVMRSVLPASSRRVWACLRSGGELGSNGLLWLPPGASSRRQNTARPGSDAAA